MAANVNNYVSAGNAAVRSAVQSRQALAENKARLDKIALAAISEDAKSRVNTATNNAKSAVAELSAKTSKDLVAYDIENDKKISSIKRGARKAGMLAGGAALLGTGAIMMNRKPEENEELDHLGGLISKLDQSESKLEDQITESESNLSSLTSQIDSLNKPDTETAPLPVGNTSNIGATTSSKLSQIVRFAEGTLGKDGYNTRYGGSKFTDLSRHPNIKAPTPWGTSSEAAGAYQFMKPTWDRASSALGLTDFSPASQDKAYQWLVEQRGVNPNQTFSNIEELKVVMDKLAPEWAGLPYSGVSPNGYGKGSSYYGQGGKSLQEIWNFYQGL